jgi:hypothetical protein
VARGGAYPARRYGNHLTPRPFWTTTKGTTSANAVRAAYDREPPLPKTLTLMLGIAAAAVLLPAASAAPSASPTAATVSPQPLVGPRVRPTNFHGDVRRIPHGNIVPREEGPEPKSPNIAPPAAPFIDSALQTSQPLAPAPAPSNSFAGLDFAGWGAGWPPDPNGDVGPNYYVQSVNTSVGIFDKTTGARVAAFTFNQLFSQAPTGTPCDSNNHGDPVALYDQIGKRWIVTDLAWSNYASGPMYQCMAVSKTSDPVSGGWWFYAWQTGPGGSVTDYPKFGVWPDGLYMSANIFSTTGSQAYRNAQVWVFDRLGMEAGQPAQFISFALPQAISGLTVFSLLPSNAKTVAGLPPVGTPNYFASIFGSYAIRVGRFHVDWQTPTNSTFTGLTQVPVALFYVGPSTVRELGGNQLDTLTYRLMMQNQYTNLNGKESLWLTHTVGSALLGGPARVRWYQVGVTGGTIAAAPIQQSSYAPDSTNRFMPSLAVDHNGDMAIGYSVSSPTMYPAIRYAARYAGDPANALTQSETTLVQGTGFQCCKFSDGSTNTRWGDYSAMTIDPDGCTFWYTNEYYNAHPTTLAGDNWLTRIGSFRLPGCQSANYHATGLVSCNTTSPRFTARAPVMYGSTGTPYVAWRALFYRFDGVAWNLGAQTQVLYATATTESPGTSWYNLQNQFVGTSANVTSTADAALDGTWAAVYQFAWVRPTTVVDHTDMQLVDATAGPAARLGTPLCDWGTPTFTPASASPKAPSPALKAPPLPVAQVVAAAKRHEDSATAPWLR